MAIYRCEIKTVSRSQGASAVAGAAYRAGLDLTDLRTGERHDYTRKNGVVASGILAPAGSPEWAHDPARLWNAAEATETRKNSVVAREFLVSLPHELTDHQRADLARDLTAHLVDRFGFAAMFAIHAPDKNADERNHHVHILATTRRMEPTGLGAKTRELDDRKTGAVEEVRAKVASTINQHLERAGLSTRVDHRSLLDQQVEAANAGDFAKAAELDRAPEPKVGRTATAAARRGKRSPRAERVQRVRADNAQHAQAQADRFRELKTQAAADGRLQHVDEQALHARALLERSEAGRARLAQTIPAVSSKTVVPPAAKRPASHQIGSSKVQRATKVAGHRVGGAAPRLAPHVHTKVIGNGSKESEQVARVANAWLVTLEKDLADLLNKALAWGQHHADPLPRALARDYFHAEGEAQVATVLRDQATADLKQARRDRHDARHYRDKGQAGLKGAGKLADRLGWTPKSLRDLQDAAKLSEDQVAMAKQSERFAIAAHEKATKEAERQRQRLLQAFQNAHPTEEFRFPDQWPPVVPSPTIEQSPSKQPGAGTGFLPPRLKPPRFRRSGPR
ncbi:MobA/MobL family protein [Stenotrophomonas maltophilia]|nr:MobA/MobL family protein [Stenotrophomonas maltophilia]MCI1087223.1 MobA/MobL family protein [Stenotrophomonas maltophilia]MCI1115123.1 MobA/MobL family protein [Stenotrophomonas maltophilia]